MTLTHQLMGIHLCTRYSCEVPTLPRAMSAKNLYGKCQATLSSLLVYRLVHALVTHVSCARKLGSIPRQRVWSGNNYFVLAGIHNMKKCSFINF